MTAILFPAATAARATTPKPCDFSASEILGIGGQCDHGMQVSWLVLPAGVVVQPGDRITITATCSECYGRGWDWFDGDERGPCHRCTNGVRTYGEATVAEVVPVVKASGGPRWDPGINVPCIAVYDTIGVVDYWWHHDGGFRSIAPEFPDSPPQPGDTVIRIENVEVAG